jgi:hypothetical protein
LWAAKLAGYDGRDCSAQGYFQIRGVKVFLSGDKHWRHQQ